jgi:hypothetical protein
MNVSEMEAKVREATNEDPWYVLDVRRVSSKAHEAAQGCKLDSNARNRARVRDNLAPAAVFFN